MINVVLVRWGRGWREVSDAASVVKYGRHEALLGLGAVGSAEEVDRVAARQLAIYADVRTEIAAYLEATATDLPTPYEKFAVADRITVPDMAGNPTLERVTALTVSEDDDGRVTYAPELKDVLLTQSERIEQALKKMADGTGQGQFKSATPVSQVVNSAPTVRPVTTLNAPPPPPDTALLQYEFRLEYERNIRDEVQPLGSRSLVLDIDAGTRVLASTGVAIADGRVWAGGAGYRYYQSVGRVPTFVVLPGPHFTRWTVQVSGTIGEYAVGFPATYDAFNLTGEVIGDEMGLIQFQTVHMPAVAGSGLATQFALSGSFFTRDPGTMDLAFSCGGGPARLYINDIRFAVELAHPRGIGGG